MRRIHLKKFHPLKITMFSIELRHLEFSRACSSEYVIICTFCSIVVAFVCLAVWPKKVYARASCGLYSLPRGKAFRIRSAAVDAALPSSHSALPLNQFLPTRIYVCNFNFPTLPQRRAGEKSFR